MKKEESNNILDNILENGFDAPTFDIVPLEIKSTPVPANVEDDLEQVRSNLYDTQDKLSSVLDFLVQNVQNQTENVQSFIKKSPIEEITDLAKTIVYVNTSILKNANDRIKNNKSSGNQNIKEQNNTQNNIFVNANGDQKPFSLKDIDDMIKVNNENKSE